MNGSTTTTITMNSEPWSTQATRVPRRNRTRRRERFGWQDAIAYLLAASVLTLSAVLPALLGRY